MLGAGSLAWAETGSQASGSPGSGPQHQRAGGLLRRAEHGDLTVRTKNGFEQVTFDRGRVTAISATSITITRPDGQSVTKTIDASTRFRGVQSASEVKTGKPAVVASKGDTAVVVGQRVREGRRPGQR